MIRFLLSVAFLSNIATLARGLSIAVGDEICAEGFIMDSFCINRGTLLDNPKVVSLEEPDQHSVHCLVDIVSCYTSPFEMLIKPYSNKTTYSRGWRLDDAGREKIIALGRTHGHTDGCTTCTGQDFDKGFRAVFKAKILNLNLEDDLLVPEVQVDGDPKFSVNLGDDPCSTAFGMQNVLMNLNETDMDALFTTQTDASFRRKRLAHGSMMLIGWGTLLPFGVLFARFFKHRPEGLWFKIHKICQPVGLLFSLIGWIIALVNFDVFEDRDTRFVHGMVGSLVMGFGLLQPINAFFRPHLPDDGGDKSSKRVCWEHFHRGAGWLCVFLAVVVVFLGTTMLPQPSDQLAFQITYAIVLITLIGFFIFMRVDKKKYDTYSPPETDDKKSDPEGDEA